MRASERLAELGLSLPAVAAPLAVYVPAVADGDHVHVSGQLPLVDGVLAETGRLGAEVITERGTELARICALNGLAAIDDLVGLDAVAQVAKVTGFVASAPGFVDQSAVLNGASELLGAVFGDAGRHARSAVGVAALPKSSPVEVELTVRIG